MQPTLAPKLVSRAQRLLVPLLPAFFLLTPMAFAQTADTELMRRLAARVDQLEHELAELKGNAAVAAPALPDDSYPRVRFSGFADLNYHLTHGGTEPSHFELGELDLFINSRISDRAGVIAETVVSSGNDNECGIDIERLIFQYKFNDALQLDAGRFHTALGYYNTAYHHGTWFQSATGRPDFVNYEDSGGILPVHMVGLSFHGAIPSGKLGLNYFAEVGNGHQFHSPTSGQGSVANTTDVTSAKAVNFALVAKPEGVPGLQFGTGFYHDMLVPGGQRRTQESIVNAHLVFKDAAWEFIGEAYDIAHAPDRGATTRSTAWFAQVARQFGSLRPYVRYTYVDIPLADAAYSLVGSAGRHHTTSVGLRWDFADYAAYKIQLDQLSPEGAPRSSEIALQVALTF
jgi:hypothetical protein